MVFEIIFSVALDVPLSYHWGEDKYEACPNCVRAHEVRSCDGETRVSWKICGKHEDITKDPYFDLAILNNVRRLIQPLYSPTPSYPLITSILTAKSGREVQDNVRVQPSFDHYSARRNTSKHWRMQRVNDPGREIGIFEQNEARMIPYPEVSYAHASGCVYGDRPDVIFKSSEAVQIMDGYARERLENINALLEAGVSYELGPEPDAAELDATVEQGERKAGYDSAAVSASASDTSSLDNSHSHSNVKDSAAATERMISNMVRNETRALLCDEKKRLEECIATSSLAKGLYFKRCNGAWVSGVGDVLRFGRDWEEVEKNREANKGKRRARAQSQGNKDDKSSLSSSTTASTISTADESTTPFTPPASPASSMSTTNSATGPIVDPSPCKSPGSLQTLSQISDHSQHLDMRTIYGYALPPYDAANTPIQDRIEQPKSNHFVYLTSMLMAREELVRSREVTAEDLVVTSWGYNRFVKEEMKERHEREEEAKVQIMKREKGTEVRGDT